MQIEYIKKMVQIMIFQNRISQQPRKSVTKFKSCIIQERILYNTYVKIKIIRCVNKKRKVLLNIEFLKQPTLPPSDFSFRNVERVVLIKGIIFIPLKSRCAKNAQPPLDNRDRINKRLQLPGIKQLQSPPRKNLIQSIKEGAARLRR